MASVLARRIVRARREDAAWIVALHADGEDARQLVPLCRAAAPAFHCCALQAPRSRNPLLGSGSAASTPWEAYRGWSWFRQDDAGRPEPASLGDALWQVEQVVCELGLAQRPYLVGHEAGATLALAAATHFGARLAGVVALGGAPGPGPDLPTLRLASDPSPERTAPMVRRWLAHQEATHGHG